MTDVRTTPRWLQVPALLALAGLAAYFGVCFSYALGPSLPPWTIFGNWQMFTTIDRSHHAVEAQVQIDGAWVDEDLEALFPSVWDGGPRYQNAFRKSTQRLRVMSDSICTRDARHPERVRLIDVRWPAKPGEPAFPQKNATRKQMIEWTCGRRVDRPDGIVL